MSDLILEKGKKDFWTLKYQGRYIHSSIDPYKEAERMLPKKLDTNIYIVFGLGLGYHIKLLIEKIEREDFYIIVFEENNEIIDRFYECKVISDPRVQIYQSKNFNQFMDFFQKELHPYEIMNPVFMDLKSETLIFQEEYQSVKGKVEEFFRYYFQSLFTEAEFIHLWYRNILINASKIFTPSFSMYLEGDAFLVAAGPSLAESLPILKKYYKKIPFFVVDTALKPVVEAGIIPDVVVATDPQIHNFRDFFNLKGFDKMILALDIACYYKIPEIFNQVYFFRTQGLGDDLFNELNEERKISIPAFPGGGSVSSSALTLIYYLGAKRVFMAGQDFCYPNITHSRSAVNHQRCVYLSNKVNTIWNFFQNIIDQRGHRDLFMQNLSKWVEDFAEITGIEVFQINPIHVLKNAAQGMPQNVHGKLYHFAKGIMREKREIQGTIEEYVENLMILRESKSYGEFIELKEKVNFTSINKAFLKQDMYLNRLNGDKNLYLGGCYRIIDRLIRACSYNLTRKDFLKGLS